MFEILVQLLKNRTLVNKMDAKVNVNMKLHSFLQQPVVFGWGLIFLFLTLLPGSVCLWSVLISGRLMLILFFKFPRFPRLLQNTFGTKCSRMDQVKILKAVFHKFCLVHSWFTIWSINSSRPDPRWREKINLNFCFHTSLWCFKRFYEGL